MPHDHSSDNTPIPAKSTNTAGNGHDLDLGELAALGVRLDRDDGVDTDDAVNTDDPVDTLDDKVIAAEIARLARLPAVRYAHQRKAAAEMLECPVAFVDRAVKAEQQKDQIVDTDGRPIELFEPEPWPEPVDGIELLNDLAAAIRRYVVLPSRAADAAVLWAIFTHAFEIVDNCAPKLVITAPTKESGKTRLLRVIQYLVPRPLAVSNITAPTVFRVIDRYQPTLLLDETDTYLREDDEMRGIINGGFDRDMANAGRSVQIGDRIEPRFFSLWAPQALAGIGRQHGTIMSRSFVIQMQRKLRTEHVSRLRKRDAGPLRELARKIARWTKDHLEQIAMIAAADPPMPPELHDRAAEAWEIPMAIADATGGEWPARARAAAKFLSGAQAEDDGTAILLLGDIRELFDPLPTAENPDSRPVESIFSRELAEALGRREDRPWAAYGRSGKLITPHQIARLLKDFGISSNNTVRRRNQTEKGYKRELFSDVFARYLPER
jgi:putative DNA primase/helicase